jgi:predicted Zn-dependent peptidase
MTRSIVALVMGACLAACATAPAPPVAGATGRDRGPAEELTLEPRVRPHLIDTSLENGLRILLVQDRTAPLVTFQVWFNVGSIYENEAPEGTDHGITGLSHFFEHLMFRGTERYPRYFDMIYAMGGKLNAFTWLDETVYWENLPSEHLPTVIAMEADRLENMGIDFLSLEPEREVVKSERRLRTDNRAEGLAWEVLQSRIFEKHAYHWGTIGWMHDLNAITIEEAQRYHQAHYAPNNATVIVVGDHDPSRTLTLIEQHYGHLPARPLPPEPTIVEPTQTAERRDRVFKSSTPQIVMWGYRAPAARERDFAVLEVIDRLLTGGKTGRLKRALVYTDIPRLSQLSTYLFPIRQPYMYTWFARLQPNTSVRELEAVLETEIERIRAGDVTPDELARAVSSLRSELVRHNLSNQRKAELLGFSLRATDDPFAFLDRLGVYPTVTIDDIQRVAKVVLDPKGRTWVPVVDRRRLTELGELMTTADPSFPHALGEMLTGAVDVMIRRSELDERLTNVEVEEEAVELLRERAALAFANADAGGKKAIETYMSEAEGGLAKRLIRSASMRADAGQLEDALRVIETRLRRKLKRVRRAKWDTSHPPYAMALNLVENVLQPWKEERVEPISASLQVAPKGDNLGARVAWEVLMAFAMEDLAQNEAASAHRRRALEFGREAMAAAPVPDTAHELLEVAYELAWDTRLVGVELEDESLEPEVGP